MKSPLRELLGRDGRAGHECCCIVSSVIDGQDVWSHCAQAARCSAPQNAPSLPRALTVSGAGIFLPTIDKVALFILALFSFLPYGSPMPDAEGRQAERPKRREAMFIHGRTLRIKT